MLIIASSSVLKFPTNADRYQINFCMRWWSRGKHCLIMTEMSWVPKASVVSVFKKMGKVMYAAGGLYLRLWWQLFKL